LGGRVLAVAAGLDRLDGQALLVLLERAGADGMRGVAGRLNLNGARHSRASPESTIKAALAAAYYSQRQSTLAPRKGAKKSHLPLWGDQAEFHSSASRRACVFPVNWQTEACAGRSPEGAAHFLLSSSAVPSRCTRPAILSPRKPSRPGSRTSIRTTRSSTSMRPVTACPSTASRKVSASPAHCCSINPTSGPSRARISPRLASSFAFTASLLEPCSMVTTTGLAILSPWHAGAGHRRRASRATHRLVGERRRRLGEAQPARLLLVPELRLAFRLEQVGGLAVGLGAPAVIVPHPIAGIPSAVRKALRRVGEKMRETVGDIGGHAGLVSSPSSERRWRPAV